MYSRSEEPGERIDADTLLLPEGLEAVEYGALDSFAHIHRLIVPDSVTEVSGLDADGTEIDEVLLLGDPHFLLDWSCDAFTDERLALAFCIFLQKLSRGSPLPEKTDGGYLLR